MANSNDTLITQLCERRDEIISRLNGWTGGDDIGDKPNTSGPGANLDHVGFRLSLYRELEAIRREIVFLEGPVEGEHLGI